FLLDTDTFFKSVRNKLLESGKEFIVVALWIIRPDPRSIDETVEYVPLEQCFHLVLELHAELVPVTLVLSMDEKGSKQVDVLDVQPAAAANEKIAAAVFEWQLGLHNTMLARFLPPIKISVEVPLCVIEHQTFPRADSVGVPQRMSRGLPECSAAACPTPSRTRSPTMPNDERQVSLESIPGSGFPGYQKAQIQ